MKIKKILFMFLIGVCVGITNVNAQVGQIENPNSFIFEYNNQVHVISERNILCDGVNFDESEIDGYDLEGNFYFEDSENFETYKITKKNTCEIASNEDLFNMNNQHDRYKFVLEKDNSGNVFINFYENRYEEAFYETLDTQINNNKTYYVFDAENVEMKEYKENEFQSNQIYYEKGYASLPHNSEKDEKLTYYKRYGSYIIDNAFIINISEEYTSENVNNFYIITDINKPIKSVKVNQEAFKDLDDYDDINIMDMGGNYIIQLTTTGNDSIYKDIKGNVLAKGKNLIIGMLGNDLYNVFDLEKNTSSIYYKDYSTKVIDGEKYNVIANSYFSKYYNLGLAMILDDANNMKNILVEHKIYEIVEGLNQTYTNSDLEFTFSGELDLFHRILINNVEIDETNYSKVSGSTIINLKSEFLDTLENGTYTLRIEYTDGGYVETPFKVNKDNALPTFNLILDANGGTFKNDVKTINIEDIINFDYETFEKPTRDGYKFIGFYTKDGKSYYDIMNSEAGIVEDTTFYAKWEENSDVSEGTPGIPEDEENNNNTGNTNQENTNTDNNNTGADNNAETGNNPQTSDNIMLYVLILSISTLGIIIISKIRQND